MIKTIQLTGFKNFRGKTVTLTDLKRINILVGINGSGKSSLLEALVGVSRLSQLNREVQDVLVSNIGPRLHSLFEPETEIIFEYDDTSEMYGLKITPQVGDRWRVVKSGSPRGGTDVVAIMRANSTPFGDESDHSRREERPFGGIKIFNRDRAIVLPDIEEANKMLLDVNPGQRQIRKQNLSVGQLTFEEEKEVRPDFLAGGSRYLAGLIAAIREMRNNKPLLLIDDLGDELFPAVRKRLVSNLNERLTQLPESKFAQVFATTHNIEVVKSALNHPEYCNVYMFDYDGGLLEFDGVKQKKVQVSPGLQTAEAVPAIAKMLGIGDIDLGFPELVILTEEETKKTFLEALAKNSTIRDGLRKFEVLVPFQAGDGNVARAVGNLLDLSKYLFFSEVWSDRYAIFVDYNETDYGARGYVSGDSHRQKALAAVQQRLGLHNRFILTKSDSVLVKSMEETYPAKIWEMYKSENSIEQASPVEWLASLPRPEVGIYKSRLAEYVAGSITMSQFMVHYSDLHRLLSGNYVHNDEEGGIGNTSLVNEGEAELIDEALISATQVVIDANKASASLLQRRLRIGYARAARLIEDLEKMGIVGEADGARPRAVLVESLEEAKLSLSLNG